MSAMTRAELRTLIAERLVNYGGPELKDTPPPQLVEAMVDVETGGNLDPAFVDPVSGARGLGNITLEGQEWGWVQSDPEFRARWGNDVSDRRLGNAAFNLDVMIYGLNRRQEMGGAYTDWYMTSAGYLGGATTSGFNAEKDGYGTTGQQYVKLVQDRIADNWSESYVLGIDALQPGTVRNAQNPGNASYDPDKNIDPVRLAGAVYTGGDISIGSAQSGPVTADIIYDLEAFTDGAVKTPLEGGGLGLPSVVGDIAGTVGRWLPRIGLFLLGIVLIIGAVMLGRR